MIRARKETDTVVFVVRSALNNGSLPTEQRKSEAPSPCCHD